MKKSWTVKILELMENGEMVSNVELSKVICWRFWGYIHNLRKKWVVFSKVKGKDYLEYWTIEHIPETLKYKGLNSIKDMSIKNAQKWYHKLFRIWK